jgi:hypothetical protein
MKYYLYVSDAKLEMLYSQIPVRMRDKIAAELKVDLKVISATFSEKNREESRYTRLDVVCNYIHENLPVGNMAHPESYFAGTISMQWGLVTGTSSGRIVYFGGEEGNVVLGLAGSRHHVVGFQGEGMVDTPPTFGAGSSMVHGVLEQLEANLAEAVDRTAQDESSVVVDLKQPGPIPRSPVKEERALETVLYTTRNLLGPTQSLEFLAKRLLTGKLVVSGEETGVLLGTRLYVALAD